MPALFLEQKLRRKRVDKGKEEAMKREGLEAAMPSAANARMMERRKRKRRRRVD